MKGESSHQSAFHGIGIDSNLVSKVTSRRNKPNSGKYTITMTINTIINTLNEYNTPLHHNSFSPESVISKAAVSQQQTAGRQQLLLIGLHVLAA